MDIKLIPKDEVILNKRTVKELVENVRKRRKYAKKNLENKKHVQVVRDSTN